MEFLESRFFRLCHYWRCCKTVSFHVSSLDCSHNYGNASTAAMSSLLQREITRIELCERLRGRSFSCFLQCLADDGVRQKLNLYFLHVMPHMCVCVCVCVSPKMAAPQLQALYTRCFVEMIYFFYCFMIFF